MVTPLLIELVSFALIMSINNCGVCISPYIVTIYEIWICKCIIEIDEAVVVKHLPGLEWYGSTLWQLFIDIFHMFFFQLSLASICTPKNFVTYTRLMFSLQIFILTSWAALFRGEKSYSESSEHSATICCCITTPEFFLDHHSIVDTLHQYFFQW